VWSENSLKYALIERYCQCNFRGSEYLCKLDKEYLNTLLCKYYNFIIFSRQNLQTFDISHAFPPCTAVLKTDLGHKTLLVQRTEAQFWILDIHICLRRREQNV